MTKHYQQKELQERYGASESGHFYVRETIGVPHPYCITPKHVEVASDDHCGILNEAAIQDAEKNHKAKCGICMGKLYQILNEKCDLILNKIRSRKGLTIKS